MYLMPPPIWDPKLTKKWRKDTNNSDIYFRGTHFIDS